MSETLESYRGYDISESDTGFDITYHGVYVDKISKFGLLSLVDTLKVLVDNNAYRMRHLIHNGNVYVSEYTGESSWWLLYVNGRYHSQFRAGLDDEWTYMHEFAKLPKPNHILEEENSRYTLSDQFPGQTSEDLDATSDWLASVADELEKTRNNILGFISTVRDSFIGAEHVYKNGSCYYFANMLQTVFPGGTIVESADHCMYRFNSDTYDIGGLVPTNYDHNTAREPTRHGKFDMLKYREDGRG